MKTLKSVLFLIVIIISVLGIFFAREIPSAPLWKDYITVYFSSDIDQNAVIDSFNKNNIKNYIYSENQYLPLLERKNSIQNTFYNILKNSTNDDYSKERYAYFFDKENKYKVCYCPAKYEKELNSCVKELNKENISIGLDNNVKYPFLIPLSFLVAFIFLFMLSKNRKVFTVGMIFPLLFIFCNSFYSSVLSILCISLLIFILSNIWKRDGFIQCIYKNVLFDIILTLSLLLSFSYSIKTGFIFILSIIGTFSMIYLYSELEEKILHSYSFQPIYIKPASKISKYAGKEQLVLTGVIGFFILVSLASFVFSSNIQLNNSSVLLPSAQANEKELPSLQDYSKWRWNIDTFPYKSLNQNAYSENEIVFTEYEENNGKIITKNNIFKYDDNYQKDVLNDIELLPFDAIEKMLIIQNTTSTPGYSQANKAKSQINIFYIVLMLCTFISLLIIYISFVKIGSNKK